MFVYHMYFQESQKTASDALELGLGTVVRCYVGAGTKLKSTTRAASALTIEPSPQSWGYWCAIGVPQLPENVCFQYTELLLCK